MYVVNQDRDNIFLFKPNALFYTAPVIVDGTLFGINLIMGNSLLGTFDSVDKAVAEIDALFGCKQPVYAIRGFSDWSVDI